MCRFCLVLFRLILDLKSLVMRDWDEKLIKQDSSKEGIKNGYYIYALINKKTTYSLKLPRLKSIFVWYMLSYGRRIFALYLVFDYCPYFLNPFISWTRNSDVIFITFSLSTKKSTSWEKISIIRYYMLFFCLFYLFVALKWNL